MAVWTGSALPSSDCKSSSPRSAPERTAPNTFDYDITATDGTDSTTATVTLEVLNVDDPITGTGIPDQAATEGTAITAVDVSLSFSDDDPGKPTGRIGKAALVVSAGILLSRVLGMLRNVALAGLLGNTSEGDAFQAAFLIPDVLFYLMAGGYLTVTFIPILTRHLVRGDEEEGNRAFAAVFRPVAIGMVLITVLAMIFAESLTDLVYPRFDALQAGEVTRLTRIVLPAQIFFVLGSLWMAVQYAHHRFAIPAVAPIIYNLGIIAGGLISWALGTASPAGFAWGAVGGAFAGNFALQWYGARRVGLRWMSGVPFRHPALGEYLTLALPLMLDNPSQSSMSNSFGCSASSPKRVVSRPSRTLDD